MTTPHLEKMTVHANSKTWHQFFVQNLCLLRSGQFKHRKISCKEEVESRRDSNVAWIPVHLKIFYTFDQFKAILEEKNWSYIARQRVVTERLRRAHLSRWKLPSSSLDWFWMWKCQEKEACGVFYSRKSFADQHKEVEYDLTKTQNCSAQKMESTPKIQYIDVIWGLLRVKDCSSIKHDPTQSFSTTLYPRCASRRWWTWSQEKNFSVKCISLLSYRKELYASRICIMDVRILPNLEREHPSTILAVSTGRPVVVESTRRPVAVTLTSESKDGHIQPSNNKMTPSRNQSKSWFIHLKRIQIAKRRKLTWTRIKRSTHSARSRRT